jgi:hypothetical protein
VEIPTAEAEAALEVEDKGADAQNDLQLKKAKEVLNGLVSKISNRGKGKARKLSEISL